VSGATRPRREVEHALARLLGRALLCTAVYLAACAWLTWPLAAQIATHLPDTHPACRFDTLFTGWLLSYVSHRLTTAPLLLAQANIYAPTRDALFYGPTCAAAVPFFAPVYLASGSPTLALNTLLLGGAALSATALHLVVQRWTRSHAAGAAAGAVFLLNRWLLWEFPPTAPVYALLLWFPLIMLLLADARPSWRRTAMLVPLVLAQELVHFGYIAPSVLGPLALLAAIRVLRPSTRRAGLQLALVVGVGALALAPELLAYRAVQQANPELVEQTIWRGLAQPSTRIPGDLIAYQVPTAVAPVALALIALGLLLLLLPRRHRSRPPSLVAAWRHAGFWAIAGTLLSLTPTVEILGRSVATPRAWAIEWLPLLGRLRVPARLGLGAYVALAALAGLALHEVVVRAGSLLAPAGGRTPRERLGAHALAWTVCLAFVAAVYLQYAHGYGGPRYLRGPLPSAYPLAAAIDDRSPILAELRRGRGPLLELPVGPGGLLPYAHTRAMYRSIFHWRPLVNGYDSYWPAAFPERMRLALLLPDGAAVDALRAATGLTAILVHTGEMAPDERSAWLALATGRERRDVWLIARDGDELLFAVGSEAAHAG
jgi:hypothetical protein